MAEPALEAPREPLQARSRATRRRLLDATIETLIASGTRGTTTTAICRAAGVSQGALFKHFGAKRELLAAAVGHLFAQLIVDFEAGFEALPEQPDRVGAAIGLLRQTFAEPRLLAAFELYTAARTDSDLRDALGPVMAEHRDNLRWAARRLFPSAARADVVADAVVSAVQGAALGGLVLAEPGPEDRSLEWLEQAARRELGDV